MADFNKAFEILLKHEGGYVNDPDDKGGETKYGISKKSYPEIDISTLDIETAKSIYKNDYWDPLDLDNWPYHEITYKVFDFSVNMGLKQAIILFQIAINSMIGNILDIDGIFGKKTNEAFKECDFDQLLMCYKSAAASYYCSLNNHKYIKGWLKRAYS